MAPASWRPIGRMVYGETRNQRYFAPQNSTYRLAHAGVVLPGVTILGTSLYLGLTEQLTTSVVVTLNTIALYMLFTVLHAPSIAPYPQSYG